MRRGTLTIEDFADRYRLKTRVDECGEKVIPGRIGDSHIYVYAEDGTRYGVMIVGKGSERLPVGHCLRAERFLEAIGCECSQRGDFEGAWLFDPENDKQARAAMKFAKIRPKRQMSDRQREVAFSNLARLHPRKGT